MKTQSIFRTLSALSLVFMLTFGLNAYAANNTNLSIAIGEGSISIDVVDNSGSAVASPTVSMTAPNFNFAEQASTGTFGTAAEKIRVFNPTSTSTWTASVAATGGATATWVDGGSNTMDYNDPSGARLTIDPSSGTIVANGGSTTNITSGSSQTFDQGNTDSITLFSASSGAATFDFFDLTGVALSQVIPGSQAAAAYTLNMTLTVI